MKIMFKVSSISLIILCSISFNSSAEQLHLFTNKTPTAKEMALILFPELVVEEKTVVKTRSILFNTKNKPSETTSIGMPVNFAFGSYELQAEALPFLEQFAMMLGFNNLTDQKIIIEGHTDAIGEKAYNKTLSIKRANAVKQYLVKKHNISADRLIVSGKGESEFLPGKSPKDWLNRRVEFMRNH